MKRSKLASILKKAEMISKAIESETEEILEDTENAVKEAVPASSVGTVLIKIENALEKEGIEVSFQKNVSKLAMAKTASEKLEDKEVEKLVEKIVAAVVDELEDVLEDADEVCDEEIEKLGEEEDFNEVEGKLKGILEKKLAGKGIYVGLARTASKKKENLTDKVAESLAARRAKRK
jgi:uncharacterized metal-binding protein